MKDESEQTPAETGFSQAWLAIREPFDHAARCAELTGELSKLDFQNRRILDLGCGTGSNLRYLLPQLGHHQQWTLVDNDTALLAAIADLLEPWAQTHAATISSEGASLVVQAKMFSAVIERVDCNIATDLGSLPWATTGLVTGSALLDLTSATWIEELAQRCHQNHCAALFVLNYSGVIEWTPASTDDDLILRELNLHQRQDKGFGPALGPDAGDYFATQLQALGKPVITTDSPWRASVTDTDLQQALIDGWVPAVIEQSPPLHDQVEHWQHEKRRLIDKQATTLHVSHMDVLAMPV